MRPGQQSPRKPALPRSVPDRTVRFNEAGATIAPETSAAPLPLAAHRLASMRPGQQSPRKPRGRSHSSLSSVRASMRPGQQSPRKPGAPRRPRCPSRCFNEAGATIAPETQRGRGAGGQRHRASMRPGQQSPRKPGVGEIDRVKVGVASMRPGQQSPRKLSRSPTDNFPLM